MPSGDMSVIAVEVFVPGCDEFIFVGLDNRLDIGQLYWGQTMISR
jgi:hypothetical protein